MNKKGKVRLFIILGILSLLVINLTLISGYLLLVKYGTMHLNPGEKYTLNIPFIGPSRAAEVCGTAEQADGEPLAGVKVQINYSSDDSPAGEAVTDANGEYCITLPEITSTKIFDVYVQYDNGTSLSNNLTLASNDYDLNFDNNLNYSKSLDHVVELTGEIVNKNARIEDGRLEINLKYYNETTKEWVEIFDYKKYSLNIEPEETYAVPNSAFSFSWEIPGNAELGRYKFYIKTSFNAKERNENVYFNLNA